ncbi:uncharacterized protein PFL1_00174 [Pseudozyma flocculosa PF-1]|uniref:Uncharacterized protein n=1 Tax=Pseudozyma flocculosa TaxID=84751 RepID=A0A5C3EST6_9BASI|nr:uncharacterized protein PFL1_00174 [Pseudozyma flocculosa PF-1]EPQ31976.1 hypothetical protein PFL1_00174 [Pseudozyma flocculosa PF-1]SPO35102.1 uncharacterized protein PSFLO_00573 [Pseudozyma flocculosa]
MRPVSGFRSPTLAQCLEDWSRASTDPHYSMDGSDRSSSQFTDVDTPPSIAYAIFPSTAPRPPIPAFEPKRLVLLQSGSDMTLSRSYESDLNLDCGLFPLPPTRNALEPEAISKPPQTNATAAARNIKTGIEVPSGSSRLGILAEDSEDNAPGPSIPRDGRTVPYHGTSSSQYPSRSSPIRTSPPRRRPHTSDALQRSASTDSQFSTSSSHHRLISLGNMTIGEPLSSRSRKSSSGSTPPQRTSSPRLASSLGFDPAPAPPRSLTMDEPRSKTTDAQARRLSARPRATPPPRLPLPDPYAANKAGSAEAGPSRQAAVRPRTASLSSRSSRGLAEGQLQSNRSSRECPALPSPITPLTPMPRTPGSATPLGRVPFPYGEAEDYLGHGETQGEGARMRSRSTAAPAGSRPRTAPGPSGTRNLQPVASASNLLVTPTPQRPEIRRSRSSTFRTVSQTFGGKLRNLAKTLVGTDKDAESDDEDTSGVWGTRYRAPTPDLEEWWMDTLVQHNAPSKTFEEPAATAASQDYNEAIRGLTSWAERATAATKELPPTPTRIPHPYQFNSFTDTERLETVSRSSSNRSSGRGGVDERRAMAGDAPALAAYDGEISLDYASIALGITETEFVDEDEEVQPPAFEAEQRCHTFHDYEPHLHQYHGHHRLGLS